MAAATADKASIMYLSRALLLVYDSEILNIATSFTVITYWNLKPLCQLYISSGNNSITCFTYVGLKSITVGLGEWSFYVVTPQPVDIK